MHSDGGVVITGVGAPGLFTGTEQAPLQVVRVELARTRPTGPLAVTVEGRRVRTPHPRLLRAEEGAATVEVAVCTQGAAPGERLPVAVRVTTLGGAELAAYDGEITVAEPGWTLRLVSHFHYDPMWWNTQAAYTALWDAPQRPGEPEKGWEYVGVPAFTLVPLHLQAARDDPGYRFVLSEIDYLKPFWDTHPEYRAELRQLIAEGRVEIVGGTYNEPSTNLTCAESTVRSAVHGLAFHQGVLGAAVRTAWQLDVFGHDPAFPALMAGAGLDSAVLARGPHHQWGPMMDRWGEPLRPPKGMQLPAEYEWIGPGGEGLLLHYLPAHYSAGWPSHRAGSVDEAFEQLLELYELLRPSASTRNVLVPMGTDFSWPHPWGMHVQHAFRRRYVWPRVEHAGPREHFAAVRAELAARGERPLPVTREMGPIYAGKDVTYADVKQAHRAAENLLQQAETAAALAHGLTLAEYPRDALGRAWRHLLHAAHHDGVTGTFSDQVYLDLLPTWREAHETASRVRGAALRAIVERVDTLPPSGSGPGVAVTVFNTLSWARTDVVRMHVAAGVLGAVAPERFAVRDAQGALAPVHVEAVDAAGGAEVAFLARDVPALGHRTWWLVAADCPRSGGWSPGPPSPSGPPVPAVAENGTYRIEADPARGGGLCRVTDLRTGRELLTEGEVDELVVQDEYPAHPYFEEGPWHLLPKGPGIGSGAAPAESCTVERGPLGTRITATGRTGPVRWRRTATLWDGLHRVELTTDVEEFTGSDQLLRLRVPADVPGALPVADTAAAVIGRGFAFPSADTGADHTRAPRTLDSPCQNWFGLSATSQVSLRDAQGAPVGRRAVGAVELVLPDAGLPGHGQRATTSTSAEALRELVVALARLGVTATPTPAAGPRWGDIAVDSSLPDLRIAIGGPDENAFTAAVLAAADPAYEQTVRTADSPTLVWVPARSPLRETWRPGCDLTGVRDLPVAVLVTRGGGAARGVARLGEWVARRGGLDAVHPVPGEGVEEHGTFAGRTVGLLVRGTPGFAVDAAGCLYSSLMRSCTGRPSGAWMDPPRRTAPDGSSFQLQRWTHRFEHALVAADGDWRDADMVRRGREFNQPLTAVVGEPAAGELPDGRSLLAVEPADRVLVETVKLAEGVGDALAVRLRETHGSPATPALRGPLAASEPLAADLLDTPREEADLLDTPREDADLRGNDYATVLLPLPDAPPPQHQHSHPPDFSRYWLHNTGTAPLGNMPYSVNLTPRGPRETVVTVSGNLPPGGPPAAIALAAQAPPGWGLSWERREVVLSRDGHAAFPLTIDVPPSATPGEYLVRVTATPDQGPGAVTDSLTVTVPGTTPGRLALDSLDPVVHVPAGGHARARFRLRNTLRSLVRGQVLATSPYGTWRLFGPAAVCVEVPGDGEVELGYDVRPPADLPPGTYWAAVKAVCDGHVAYSPSIALRVESTAQDGRHVSR
ncbi:glycoside hydrolase [Streptomyces sp. E11-3]|uniref:glycoside hydrolase family 38 N-terminal domain-containing protein n=1 Tax=Streptomyces sp. E11-3 TaxID=3110112 RepID=UPI003980AAFB